MCNIINNKTENCSYNKKIIKIRKIKIKKKKKKKKKKK